MPDRPERSLPKQLSEQDRQILSERLNTLGTMLDVFPETPVDGVPNPHLLSKAEAWARAAVIVIFNTFNTLVATPYRTRQMDAAVDTIKQAFHAVFELAFSTKRRPNEADFQRARTAIEDALTACHRLV